MDRTAGGSHFKDNLKLALCLAGITVVIIILVAMRPVENHNQGLPEPAAAAAKVHSRAPALAVSAAPLNQAVSAAATGASLAASSGLQSIPPVYTPPSPPGSPAASAASPPIMTEPSPLYPIDPIPCNSFKPNIEIGCDRCEASPDGGAYLACVPRCPIGGREIMCAY